MYSWTLGIIASYDNVMPLKTDPYGVPVLSDICLSPQSIENGRNLVALSCSIKLVNAIVSAEKRETPITDVSCCLLWVIIWCTVCCLFVNRKSF